MALSLDDRMKNIRRGRGRARRGRGQGAALGGRRTGAARRGPLTVNVWPSSSAIAKSTRKTRPFPWQHDLFEDSLRAAGIQGVEIGTKLYVSNLNNGVTNEDIRELFSEIGDMKHYAVYYDKNGHPSGSAEVVYTRRSEAFAALKRYNNVLLDGKPMKIEIVGANAEFPMTARVNVTGVNGRRKRTVVMAPGGGRTRGSAKLNRGAGQGRGNGARNDGRSGGGGRGSVNGRSGGGGRGSVNGRSGGGGRGSVRGRRRNLGWRKRVEKSAEDLNQELETYHAEAIS